MDVRPFIHEPAMSVEIRTAVALISNGPHHGDVSARIDELEREGQPVLLVCRDSRAHEHEATRADVLHPSLLSAAAAKSFVRALARHPRRILRLMVWKLHRVPAAVHLAGILSRRGITDVQGVDPVGTSLARLVTEVSDAVPPDLGELPVEWSRLNARRVGIRWYSRRINSIVAEVSIDDGRERFVVKRQRTHAGGSAGERWARESRILRSLAEAMNDEVLTVPRILLAGEADAILVMEKARGTSIELLFAEAAADRAMMSRLADAVRGAGAWLAAMQLATRRSADGRELLAGLVTTAAEDADRLAARDRTIRRHRRAIEQTLASLQREVSSRTLIVTGQHDDYWPGNVFFDGRRVTVIDFESFRDGLWLEDAAWFLIRSDMLRRRFRLRFPDLAVRFFEGFSGSRPDPVALHLFTLTRGLRALARGVGDDLPIPQRIWTRRTIRNCVLRALEGSG
ncbi:MAG TPA: phosphotransferase [Thermoanaerobaculia bacterium]|nr:phosphotransferase [Thermoanaerobaculia bacterium]